MSRKVEDEDGFDVDPEFTDRADTRLVQDDKVITQVQSQVRGKMVRSKVKRKRQECRDLSNKIRLYVSDAASTLSNLEASLEKFSQLKVLNSKRDFRETMERTRSLISNFHRAIENLRKTSKELGVHPGFGTAEALSQYTRKFSDSKTMIERSQMHADQSVEDLRESAYSIEAERLANVLRDLSSIKDAIETKKAIESRVKIQDYQDRYTKAESSICEVSYMDSQELYSDEVMYDSLGITFLDRLKNFNLFAIVHPGIDEAEDLVREAKESYTRARKAYEEDLKAQETARSALLKKCSEIESRKSRLDISKGETKLREHRVFSALCREWWSEGIEQKQKTQNAALLE